MNMDQQVQAQREIDAIDNQIRQLTSVLIPARTQDGRNLVYHRIMAQGSFDRVYWESRVKRMLGIPGSEPIPEKVGKEGPATPSIKDRRPRTNIRLRRRISRMQKRPATSSSSSRRRPAPSPMNSRSRCASSARTTVSRAMRTGLSRSAVSSRRDCIMQSWRWPAPSFLCKGYDSCHHELATCHSITTESISCASAGYLIAEFCLYISSGRTKERCIKDVML